MLSGERQTATVIVNIILGFLRPLITIVFSVGALLIHELAFSQSQVVSSRRDTVTQLDEVVVTQTRLQSYAVGHYIVRPDTSVLRLNSVSNAAELMRKFGFGHIRSYGVGGVTTPSFRGTGGSHTSVLWNGISLVSPLNGQSDLSLLPVLFVDNAQFQSGGSATLFGSGAIGGTIQFNNKPVFGKGLDISFTENIGSFKTFFHGSSIAWSGRRLLSSIRVFQNKAENNFSFVNRNYSQARNDTREHNAFDQKGALFQSYFQITSKQLLSARFWYQDNDTEVPNPSTVGSISQATQRDQFFRSTLGWEYNYAKGHVFVQSAHVYHLLDYRNPLINLVAPSTFNTFINTVENTLSLNEEVEWTSGINYTFESADGDELQADPRRNRMAFYTAFKRDTKKLSSVLSARQELVEGKLTTFAPSLGADLRLTAVVSLFGNISRNYRIPTFNDLYWSGAGAKGNPILLTEKSWSEELGFKLNYKLNKTTSIDGQAAVFNNNVDNWIQWTPTASVWSPENIRKVWSRGIETSGTIQKQMGKVNMSLGARYSFTASTSEAVYDASKENEIGNQLFFTPKHESSVTGKVTWNDFQLSVINNYTGKQYTDDNNNEYLAMQGYNITNVWLSKDVRHNRFSGTAMIEVNNVFDQQVNTRPGYPLPGINVKAGITIRFNQPILYEN